MMLYLEEKKLKENKSRGEHVTTGKDKRSTNWQINNLGRERSSKATAVNKILSSSRRDTLFVKQEEIKK